MLTPKQLNVLRKAVICQAEQHQRIARVAEKQVTVAIQEANAHQTTAEKLQIAARAKKIRAAIYSRLAAKKTSGVQTKVCGARAAIHSRLAAKKTSGVQTKVCGARAAIHSRLAAKTLRVQRLMERAQRLNKITGFHSKKFVELQVSTTKHMSRAQQCEIAAGQLSYCAARHHAIACEKIKEAKEHFEALKRLWDVAQQMTDYARKLFEVSGHCKMQ